MFLLGLLALLGSVQSKWAHEQPIAANVVFVLTDDQDVTLGGMNPLQKTNRLIRDEGAIFDNMFVTTPLCCPSRASILTGRYAHNHGTVNNSLEGGCSSSSWQKGPELQTFIHLIKSQEYATFYAGKYLNQYGNKEAGGIEHVPPGWDTWIGLKGNSVYYNYSLSLNGQEEKHGDTEADYLTSVIKDKALSFLQTVNTSKSFFMMLCPPSAHAPFTPEVKYVDAFANQSAPRTSSFNLPAGKSKHWLLRQPPSPLPVDVVKEIDETFRNRWRTLLSVDDLVEAIYNKLKETSALDNTYIFFSSDNGYHLGQFSLPWDKRQPYEFDIRVPLLVRGPGIAPGKVIDAPTVNLDLAPTFIEISGLSSPPDMDGISLLPELYGSAVRIRTDFVVEHQGEGLTTPPPGCPQYANGVSNCEPDCICQDSFNNTYSCLRTMSETDNSIACQFQDNEHFKESYNITGDPDQLNNLSPLPGSNLTNLDDKSKLAEIRLNYLKTCKGKLCKLPN